MISYSDRSGYMIELPSEISDILGSLEDGDYKILCEKLREIYPFEGIYSDTIDVGFYEDSDWIWFDGEVSERDKWTPPESLKIIEKRVIKTIKEFAAGRGMTTSKKEFKITHREELVGWFYVEADSWEDALRVFNRKVNNGEIDFSDMELVDSSDEAEEA